MNFAYSTVEKLFDWGSPLGVTSLLIGITLSMYLLSLAVRNFDAIDQKNKKK